MNLVKNGKKGCGKKNVPECLCYLKNRAPKILGGHLKFVK